MVLSHASEDGEELPSAAPASPKSLVEQPQVDAVEAQGEGSLIAQPAGHCPPGQE